jgi:ABC-2 type transport system permease protein
MTAHAATLSRPSLPRLATVELRKAADTRAGFWLLLVTVLLSAALVTVQLIWGEAGDKHLEPLWRTTLEITAFILPILGILLVTSEWSQRTGLATFALVPQRERVIVAKVIGACVLMLAAVVATLGIAGFANLIGGGSWDLGLGDLGRGTLYELINVLLGVAFGLVFLNSALAIVMSFFLPMAWAILGGTINALDKPADWLDISRPLTALVDGGPMTGTEWAQLATAAGLWVGVLFVVGLVRLRRAELK